MSRFEGLAYVLFRGPGDHHIEGRWQWGSLSATYRFGQFGHCELDSVYRR
jgi:hypothetical protein